MTLYEQGMTVRQTQQTIRELYHGAEISTKVISNVTDAVIDEVQAWQNRLLESVYVVVYLDCIVVKVRHHGQVINKAIYIAVGINRSGYKESLGLWTVETESAKFWLAILTELQNRGVTDIFIFCVDGLSEGQSTAVYSTHDAELTALCGN